jgi:signal transduction histidine kinase
MTAPTMDERIPLSRKLTRMNMVVSTSALLLACAGFAAYDLLTFRDVLVGNLSIHAQMVGSASVSAILFDDAELASGNLRALESSPGILSAEIFKPGGERFAQYRRAGEPAPGPLPAIPAGQAELRLVSRDSVAVARRIIFDGAPAAIVYIRSDLEPFYSRLASYALLATIILVGSVFAALAISRLARRAIAAPIGEVAALARRVAESNDYTIRAQAGPRASLEYASVIESFNDMLDKIQQRDRQLADAREQLEERVQQRTEELAVAYQDLEAFNYSVSHDLRAPLRHVTGFATLLTTHLDATLDERGRRYLETMIGAANRMGKLIDDLLALSRMGRASLKIRPVDLGEVVREAQAEVLPETAGRQIVWDIHCLPQVHADPALLRPAITNLLSNAVKYTSTRPIARVEIGASTAPDGEVVVFVRDNGVGFDMKYVDKLFGIFQRLHRAEEFSGTGIGLANVRRIIHRHGGRTWAHGEVDHGATFYFSLPEHAV